MSAAIERFVEQLRGFSSPDVFNPWAAVDPAHDASRRAPEIRRRQLTTYLAERASSARLVLVAEAAGFQGAKFSGIAMTSERILLGHLCAKGIPARAVLRGRIERTSRSREKPRGFNEPTATVVWGTLLGAGIDPRAWVNWNAFACHPHRPGAPLSNRTPTRGELEAGRALLAHFLALFAHARVVALGRHAAHSLDRLEVPHHAVRHPSMGGAARFRTEVLAIVRETRASR
ncbi:MAG: uracil-DNA glycosylase [Burkholderiales bacterium]|nr:uracil-DNA glycosylase [Burkholderiales bacterium]